MDIRITDKDIDQWEREKTLLEAKLRRINRKLDFVSDIKHDQKNMTARHKLIKSASRVIGVEPLTTRAVRHSKGDPVVKILREKDRYMTPLEIKDIMADRQIPGKWGENYFYVHGVLRREVENGRVKKHAKENKYRAA